VKAGRYDGRDDDSAGEGGEDGEEEDLDGAAAASGVETTRRV
jgi:hypothetical protein